MDSFSSGLLFRVLRGWNAIQLSRIVHTMNAVEIICEKCGADTLLNREAVYDGFTKTGKRLTCSTCRHEYHSEEVVPFKEKVADPQIFTEADRSAKVDVFAEGENHRLCHRCAHYIVNPFTQFCATHKKEVQATDTCGHFEQAQEKKETDGLI